MNVGRYLLPGERRVVSVRHHPAILAPSGLASFGALLAAGTITGHVPALVSRLVWVGFLAVLSRLVWRLLEWSVGRFIVTDQRVILVTGVSTRRIAMLPLRRVTDMTYERSPMGRIFGYGEFIMESAGDKQGLRRVAYVPGPDALYLDISELLFGEAQLGTGGRLDH